MVDRAGSRAVIDVGKSGAFSFLAGHTHEVTAPIDGTLEIDPDDLARSQVRLDIDAAALTVTGKGDPPADVPKVQKVMLSDQVLDVERYPRIVFRSTAIAVKAQSRPSVDLVVTGALTLHGVTRPLAVPVHAELTDAALTATGQFAVKQSEFGMKPVSVAGVVAVKDTLGIAFKITARP